MKKQKAKGTAAFDAYYTALFKERWEHLKTALAAEPRQIAYSDNLLKPYYLDYASVQAAKAMPPLYSGKCLDMCAAPGGKTLVLLSRLSEQVELVSNEISADRRNRLFNVLEEYISPYQRRQIKITGYDACKMPHYGRNLYDRILLDAPCSSERHLFQNEKYLDQWSEARIKNLAQRQWALLSAAFLLLKENGFLVYSTCALSDFENDGVIKKLKAKYKTQICIETGKAGVHQFCIQPQFAEECEYGYRFMPDTAEGAGPIYFSLIKKIPVYDNDK